MIYLSISVILLCSYLNKKVMDWKREADAQLKAVKNEIAKI